MNTERRGSPTERRRVSHPPPPRLTHIEIAAFLTTYGSFELHRITDLSTMLNINCPWCGPRSEEEFTCGGEAHIARPLEPHTLDDKAWADYLFMRENPKGLQAEQWCHTYGCRQWFNVERDTVTYVIRRVYRVGEAPSKLRPDAQGDPRADSAP